MKKLILTLLSFCLFSSQAYAWGQNGHRIVGEIAQKHLGPNAKKEVAKLLGGESLAQVSTWPDFIKSAPKKWGKTFSWHYVNVPKGEKMVLPKKGNHILTAIENLSKTLRNKKAKKEQRATALKFLVHLVGDLHQPLHVGRNSDKGGNDFPVKWFGKKTNLHVVWDEKLIEHQELSFTEYVSFINRAQGKSIASWQKSSPTKWAQESFELRKKIYQHTKKDQKLSYEYNYVFIRALNQRLLMGGVRLAGLLNQLL